MRQIFTLVRREWAIALILIISFLMRIWALDFQSLWLDELHTLVEADPDQPWSHLFQALTCCDQHPPLYFIVERFAYVLFGHTSFVARIISVIAGTVSIWAMYCFGKEILNKRLGLIVAILTSVNHYNLKYSQEARGYIFAFLFATLSFIYLIRLVKSPNRKYALLYALYTLCLLYSHYYSLFVVVAQGILALIFIFQEKGDDRKHMFKFFLMSGAVVAIGYAPWLPFLKAMTGIQSFWISNVSDTFMRDFFYEYFGESNLLIPILFFLLFVYLLHATWKGNQEGVKKVKDTPLLLSLTIVLCWVFVTYFIPYLRSLLVVPMLFPRYTIVVLPAILLALAYGIELFKSNLIRIMIIVIIVFISLTDILFVKQFYTKVWKTQFREMMQFVTKENEMNYPIINEVTAAQNSYYMKFYHSKARVMSGKKEDLVDSILNKSSTQYE